MCLAHQRADVFCKFCAGMHHRVALGAECHVAGGAEVHLDAVPANDTARPRLHSKLHNLITAVSYFWLGASRLRGSYAAQKTTRDAGVRDEDRRG